MLGDFQRAVQLKQLGPLQLEMLAELDDFTSVDHSVSAQGTSLLASTQESSSVSKTTGMEEESTPSLNSVPTR